MDNFSALLGKELAGSGGGSGTSNYNELENKPQINGNTLSGNKTAANLGLQSAINQNNKLDADLLDDSESEKKLVSENDISNWNNKYDSDDAYTKAQTDAAITEAISALDASETGGSGKYISAISEVDGKIVATPATFDTALSSSSTDGNAPTSKTVYDDQQRQDALEAEDRAALIEQVDEGAKNLVALDIPTVRSLNPNATWTSDDTCVKGGITYKFNTDGTVVANGTADTSASKYIKLKSGFSVTNGLIASCGLPAVSQDQSKGLLQLDYPTGSDLNVYDYERSKEVNRDGTVDLYITVLGGITVSNLIFKPMICTASDWAVSQKFVPYRPSWQEMWEMIQGLQSGGASTQSVQPTLMSAAKPMIDAEEVSEKEAEPDEAPEIEEKEGAEER